MVSECEVSLYFLQLARKMRKMANSVPPVNEIKTGSEKHSQQTIEISDPGER